MKSKKKAKPAGNSPQPGKKGAEKHAAGSNMPPSNILEKYSVSADGMDAEVTIARKLEEYVPIYGLKRPEVTIGTRVVLNAIREELITMVHLSTKEFVDPGAVKEVKERFSAKAIQLMERYLPGAPESQKKILAGALIHEMLGLGDIELLLEDPYLEEIVINGHKEPVWVYHKKHGWLKTTVRIQSEDAVYNFSASIGRRVGRQITNLDPLMDAHLITGDRVNATLFPISTEGNTITIRKFSRSPWTIIHFLEANTLSTEAAALIWTAMQYEMNVLVCGGTASGKTSMLNVLLPFIPPNQRIISIEDTREINLPEFLHWVPFSSRGANPEGKGEVCMYPGSHFIDGNGEMHEISEFVNHLIEQNGSRKIKENVEVAEGTGYGILSGDPLRMSYKKEKVKCFSKISGRKFICEVICNDGTKMRITENTKLPVMSEDGKIKLLVPREITPMKSYIPVFRKLDFEGTYQKIDIFNVFGNGAYYACGIKEFYAGLENKLRKDHTLYELAKICGIKRQAFNWYRKTGTVRISVLKKLLELSGEQGIERAEREIKAIKSRGGTGNAVKIPRLLDENLAYLAGIILAEKTIGKNRIIISQKEDIGYVLDDLVKSLFGIGLVHRKDRTYNIYSLFSAAIAQLMKRVFCATYSNSIRVPPIIMRSPDSVIASFLAGYIDGDGTIGRGRISLATSSERAVQEFRYLFLRIGVLSRAYYDRRAISLNVHSREDAVKACSLLPFRIRKNVEKAKLNLQTSFKEGIFRNRIPYSMVSGQISILKDYLNEREKYKYFYRYQQSPDKTISAQRLGELHDLLAPRVHTTPEQLQSLSALSEIRKNNIEFARVKEVNIFENKENIPSYDITPESSEYFVASGDGNFSLVQDTMLDLLVNSLRMRPDRIIIGEVRRAKEAEVMFEAIRTGHSAYATFHADNSEQVYKRLLNPPMDLPESILGALHLIVVQYRHRRRGIRRTLEIAEILPLDEGNKLNVIYRWNPRSDTLERTSRIIRMLNEINMYTGMSEKEFEDDLKNKAAILEWMKKNGVKTIGGVGKIFAEYYKDEKKIVSAARAGESPKDILGEKFFAEISKAGT